MEQFKNTQNEYAGLTLGGELVELSSRQNDGITVTMWWDRENNVGLVTVDDSKDNTSHVLEVEVGENPMEVFNHPFAYVEQRERQAAARDSRLM